MTAQPTIVEADAHAEAVYRDNAAEIRTIVERVERLESERKDIAETIKDVFSEATSRGYDVKILRKVIALRKRDADDIAEEAAVLEMYTQALGMN